MNRKNADTMARLPRRLESVARMLTYILSHHGPTSSGWSHSEERFIPIKHLLRF